MAWKVQRSSESANAKIMGENMLNTFFYAKGIVHDEFVPEKQTVKGRFYKELIKRLIARVNRIRPEFQESGSWYLLHKNAPAHSSGAVSKFLVKRGILCYSIHPTPLI
jgi:hypothetical protein